MALTDPKKRFSATVDNYDAYRPTYPTALVDWILKVSSLQADGKIADIGCGTGISTRLFASRGLDVIGVEPNDEMRAAAVAHGGARYQKGDSSNTGLPSRSTALIIVAQAFHWFEMKPTLIEFERILQPGAWCSAFWNDRTNETPFMQDYDALLLEFSSEYPKAKKKNAVLDAIRTSSQVYGWIDAKFPNFQSMNRAAFLGRVYSSSYVVHGVSRRPEFDKALADLFNRYVLNGEVQFQYTTEAACWQLR